MPKPAKGPKFYAVRDGRETGVFSTWDECEAQTKGYPGAKYKGFSNAADAEAFVSGTISTAPSSPSKATSSISESSDYKGKKRAMQDNVQDESEWDVVYCDGACKGNGKVGSFAGVGVWWGQNDPRNIAERCPGDQTNNRAELIAIVRMLETTPRSKKPLLIKTDSQYSINCFRTWLPTWTRNNFKTASGQPVKNLGVIQYLSALLDARALSGQQVHLQYVKGHSGDRGNDGADAQANIGALLPFVPERDWAKEERQVREKAQEERRISADKPIAVPLEVASDDLPQPTETPRKMRKVDELAFSRLPPPTSPTTTAKATSSSKSMDAGSSAHTLSPRPPPQAAAVLFSPSKDTRAPPILFGKPPAAASTLSPRPPVSPPRPPFRAATILSSPSKVTRAPQDPFANTSAPASVLDTTLRPKTLPPHDATAHSVAAASSQASRKPRGTPEPRLIDSPSRRHGAGFFARSPPTTPSRVKKFTDLPSASERARALGLVSNAYSSLPEAVSTVQPAPPAKTMAMSVNKEDVDINDYLDCLGDDSDISF